jgi:uncharacterized protein (TIGR03083 family)
MSETFALAAEGFAALVDRIPSDAWDGPGLGEWDLRSLVGHASRSLVTVQTYLDRPAEIEAVSSPEDYYRAVVAIAGADPAAVVERGRQAGLALGDDPVATVRSLLDDVLPRVRAAGNPLIETIAGGMFLDNYLPTRTFELVIHGYDIARALGTDLPDVPQVVLADVAALAARSGVVQGKGPELVLALTGRGSLPPGFSMV